jgi:hypothetical protein
MNSALINQFIAGIRTIQQISGEPITVAGNEYTCTAVETVNSNFVLEQGGAIALQTAVVSVVQQDYIGTPQIDSVCMFRYNNMRLKSYSDAITYWTLYLEQEFA